MAKAQAELKGIERPKLRDVEDAGDEYISAVEKSKRLAEDKKELAAKLVIALRRNKLTSYSWDGHIVAIEELEKVRVKSLKEADDDNDE